MNSITRLFLVFVAIKTTHLLIFYHLPGQFDILLALLLQKYQAEKEILSTALLTPFASLNSLILTGIRSILDNFVDKLATWDAVYFADLFVNGITYEHQYVFCPLWWRLIRLFPVNSETVFYQRLTYATLLSNVCHFVAAIVLYKYTQAIFMQARLFPPTRMAELTATFYLLLPAAAYLTAPYSESIAALFSLLCLFCREKAVEFSIRGNPHLVKKQVVYVASGVFASLAFGFRANCLFLGAIYIYDLVRRKSVSPLLPLAAGLILGLAFLFSNIHSYYAICLSGDRGEWCLNRFPSLFAYAQSHYWNNGFFRYWTPNNIPNFLFGAPVIGLSLFSIRYFSKDYPVIQILPASIVNGIFLTALLIFWHVQIVTRIHTFVPPMYWLCAGLWIHDDYPRLKKLVLGYFILWNIVQAALFATFLPPA